MCAENAQDDLQEKIAYLKSFVRQSNRLERQVQSTLKDIQQIRDEIETLLQQVGGLQAEGIEQVLDGDEIPDESTSTNFPSQDGQEQDGTGTDSAEDDPPKTESVRYDEPVKAGEIPADENLSWEEDEDPETDEEHDATENNGSSYRRRMVRKDPRLQDVPEEVLDRIADAEELFQEAERGIQVLDSLSVKSRSAQLAIWAGRARKIQDQLQEWSDVLPDDFSRKMHVFFGKLTTVTREHECKWIDALKRSYTTDWDRYLEEQNRKLRMSLQREKRAREFLREPPQERKKDRKICRRRLRELASEEDPSREEVKSVLIEGMDLLAMDDPAVIEVAERFSDLLDEEEQLEPLRQAVEERTTGTEHERDDSDQPEVYRRPTLGPDVQEEILELTRNKTALALADDVTNEWKRRIEDAFEFQDLTWLDIVDGEDQSLEERLEEQNVQQYDYILLMKSRLQEEYSRALEKCRERSPQTLIVEEGIGVAPIRDAFRDELAGTTS